MAAILPMAANAQKVTYFGKAKILADKESSYYMQGAVPVKDGWVEFDTTINAPGKTKEQIYQSLLQWASFRYSQNVERGLWNEKEYFKNRDFARVTEVDKTTGKIDIQGDEELVFTNKTLAKDFTRAYYQLEIKCEDGKADVRLYHIYYDYEGSLGERLTAEEWITDAESITKDGAGLNKKSGKFRVRTIDLKDRIFKEIEETINK